MNAAVLWLATVTANRADFVRPCDLRHQQRVNIPAGHAQCPIPLEELERIGR